MDAGSPGRNGTGPATGRTGNPPDTGSSGRNGVAGSTGRPAGPPDTGSPGTPGAPAGRNGAAPGGPPRHGRPTPPLQIGAHRIGRAVPVRAPLRPPVPPAPSGLPGPPTDDQPTTDLGGVSDAVETEAFAVVEARGRPAPPTTPAPDPSSAPPDAPEDPAPDAVEPAAPAEQAAPAVAPARRRRRAGESADERPASAYRATQAKGSRAPRSGRRRRPAFWKELPLLVVVALMLTFLIQTFLAKVYVIPSGSMETTLHGCTGCVNDRVLVDKVSYRFSEPEPGDVVVFRGPDSWGSEIEVDEPTSALARGLQQFGSLIGLAPPNEKDFVKRVIAVGGQTVQCCDAANRVLVDGKPLDEPYIYYLPEAGRALQQGFGPYVVPRGYLWMMGDSRNNSSDSRAPGHGPVPIDNVIGKAQFIVLPVTRISSIEAINPQTTPAVGMGVPADVGGPAAVGLLVALPLWWRRRTRWTDADGAAEEFLPGHPPHRG